MLSNWDNILHQLDDRYSKLVMLIKIWIQTNVQLSKFYKYFSDESILLLVIFYLNKSKLMPNLFIEFPEKMKLGLLLKIQDLPEYQMYLLLFC